MRKLFSLSLAFILVLGGAAFAQDEAPPPLKPEELDQLTAPIALYPDSLLSQVFMATTYPADVAAAAEWSAAHPDEEGDAAIKLVEGEAWDPSVKSLCAFPAVLAMMKEKPDWVQQMGDAFLGQSKDVMDSVQRLRQQAQDAGNLKSNEQQVVKEEPAAAPADATSTSTSTSSTTTIVIEPADPEVVYVPTYDTQVVYGSWAWPSYPPYYFPPPPYYYPGGAIMAGIGFATGIAIMDGLWGDCDWGGGDIDIDVDRYNNINVGNEINRGSNNGKWEHNAANRDGVPYRDSGSREKYGKGVSGADQRSEYRGRESTATASQRDAQRQAASSQFQNSTGVNPRDTSRTSADQINRDLSNRGASPSDLSRAGTSTRQSGGASAGTRDVSSGSRASAGGAGVSSRDVGGGSSYSGGSRSSSTFSSVDRPAASNQSVSRGTSSAGGRSMSSGGGGARAGGGGGGGRSGGGGGGRR